MLVKINHISRLYGFGHQTVKTIIERGEFERYRTGGTGGIFIEWNEQSKELFEYFLKPKLARRGNYGDTERYCTSGT